MARVLLISTGGTIAMTSGEERGAVSPTMDGRGLLGSLSDGRSGDRIEVVSPCNLPSAHLRFRQLLDLSRQVNEAAASSPDIGVVITMGTDTMEEVAYFLDLTYRYSNPVIVTGAMRSPSQLGADGSRNLDDALKCAVSGACRDLGVLVVMNGEIHAAADVVKMHTTDVSSFKSPRGGVLGAVAEGRVELYRRRRQRETVELTGCDESVELVCSAVGDTGRAIRALLEAGAGGFVVEGFGVGHVSPEMKAAIREARDNQVPVVMVSRCAAGDTLRETYDYEGSEIDLRSLGVFFAEGLNGPKARIKLSVLLGNPTTRDRLADYFK